MQACGEACFDRQALLERILRRAVELPSGYRQNLALLGPPLIGKTTILLKSAELLARHPALLVVYLELRRVASLAAFVEQFAATLLYQHWVTACGQDPPQSMDALVQCCRSTLPKTTELLRKAVARARRGHPEALVGLFEAPGEFHRESGRFCVILLDDFDRLAAWGKTTPFDALGRQIVVQQETMYLLASSSVAEARRILGERLAVLFGHFEVLEVGPFEWATSVRYLMERADLGALGSEMLMAIADLTEGHPFFLETIARAVRASDAPDGAEPVDRLIHALEQVLFRPTGVLWQQGYQALGQLPERRRAALVPLLLAMADGCHRMSAIAEVTGRSLREVARGVRALVEAGLVVRQGVFCRIPQPLMRVWLKTAYSVGPVQMDPTQARERFARQIREWLTRSTPRGSQAVLETVAELMRRFRNELVEMGGRRLRFPRLDVHTLLLPGIPRAVLGRRDKTQWLCVPYPTGVREGDAVTLVQTLRLVSRPWGRRIVIALGGIEVGARLFLQDQRFWVWERQDLNQLLELYGLPRLLPTDLNPLALAASAPPESLAVLEATPPERQAAG